MTSVSVTETVVSVSETDTEVTVTVTESPTTVEVSSGSAANLNATDTSNFDGLLSASESTVQKALDALDDITVADLSLSTNLTSLTDAEVTQLLAINSVTVTNAQWGYLGAMSGQPLESEVNDLTASVTWANVPDANITESSVTQHEGAIDHGNLTGLSTGADHSYIDQDVTSGASPTLDGTNFTGIPSSGLAAGVGIADDNIVEIDGSPSDNDYAKFTANGLEGRSYPEILSDLSGQANSSFDWNGQSVTAGKFTLNQQSDDDGLEIYGYDDKSSSYLRFAITSNGTTTFTSSYRMLFNTGGFIFFNSGAVGYYFDIPSGGNAFFRDSDNNVIANLEEGGDFGLGVTPDTKLDIDGAFTFRELSSDPSDPDEGSAVMWMSDGTGTGDDGDVLMKITAGGVTKTATIADFSGL
jgi:hypothetical protein